jgi:hypothetical protein
MVVMRGVADGVGERWPFLSMIDENVLSVLLCGMRRHEKER